MPVDVVLSYRRAGTLYQGNLDGQPFSEKDFAAMMSLVHLRLLEFPESGLTFQRTDREGLLPIKITDDLVRLLREDPAQYIRMHSVAPVRIDLTGRTSALAARARTVLPKTSGIRAGYDTIADAFGEVVYARFRNCNVESPESGRWVILGEVEKWLGQSVNAETPGWVSFKVADLLATTSLRFYLPREWNPYHGWITKEQLAKLLEQFLEERSALCQSVEKTKAL